VKKIALYLSGQPRNAVLTAERIKKTIINNNDVDVFLHCWYDENDLSFHKRCPGHWDRKAEPNIKERLIEIYKPKSFLFEKPKNWTNNNMIVSEENIKKCYDYGLKDLNGIDFFGKHIVNACHSQWYSNMMANLLKEQYAIENGIKYDYVVKLRYDVSPSVGINFEDLNDKLFYYQNLNQPLNMTSDWFALGSNETMNIWSNLYFQIEKLYREVMSEEGIWCNELLSRNHLKNNKITATPIDFGVCF
jgi:hypothetical protein